MNSNFSSLSTKHKNFIEFLKKRLKIHFPQTYIYIDEITNLSLNIIRKELFSFVTNNKYFQYI